MHIERSAGANFGGPLASIEQRHDLNIYNGEALWIAVRGQFVQVAGSTQELEVTGFKAAANDVLYTLRDSAGAESKDVSQANLTGLNKFNSESWTGEPWKIQIPFLDRLKTKLKIG